MVLGLSLTSDEVVWVLVDETDRTVADHDSVEFRADSDVAGACARGARAIAAADGIDVERIRLTWSDDVARDGLRLRSRLSSLGFDNVEAVPLRCAGAVMVDPGMEPSLALAYGAALADVSVHEAITVPLATRTKSVKTHRGRIALAVLGAAAAAALGGLLLTSGSLPHVEQTASASAAAEPPASADPGWVAVSAPAETAGVMVRKVVEALDADVVAAAAPVQETVPQAAEPVAVAVAEPAPVAVPHLPEGVPTWLRRPPNPSSFPSCRFRRRRLRWRHPRPKRSRPASRTCPSNTLPSDPT